MTRREQLEKICAMLGQSLAEELNDASIGFALMVFDFGPGGFTAYVSNANREDMIKALREQIARLEKGCN